MWRKIMNEKTPLEWHIPFVNWEIWIRSESALAGRYSVSCNKRWHSDKLVFSTEIDCIVVSSSRGSRKPDTLKHFNDTLETPIRLASYKTLSTLCLKVAALLCMLEWKQKKSSRTSLDSLPHAFHIDTIPGAPNV